MLSPLSHAKPVIMVLGDSISAGYGMPVQQGWVTLLEQQLRPHVPQVRVVNESISGDTSAGGLARLAAALQRNPPDWLLLELGANDGLRGLALDAMQSNLTQIIQRAHQVGTQVMLLGVRIPPNYGKRYTEQFYSVYPQLAKQFNLLFVPFIMEDIALNPQLMQNDGLHPNQQAQPLIAEKISQTLLPRLSAPH